MKTIIYILILLSTISTYSQVYVNLQGGTAENKQTTNTTLTYQVGFRYQPSDFGFKASFNQTDGLYHTFESYTFSGTWQPVNFMYLSAGYRHDNGLWGRIDNGANVGINALIPAMENVKVIISFDSTVGDIFINNIMVGFQLDLILNKKTKNRFF